MKETQSVFGFGNCKNSIIQYSIIIIITCTIDYVAIIDCNQNLAISVLKKGWVN